MVKTILAVAVMVALSACSSSDDGDDGDDNDVDAVVTPTTDGATANTDDTDNTTTDTPASQGTIDPPTGGGDAPVAGTRAGSYTGNFGGAEGVYVINNDNELAGVAISADGSAQSLFGDVGDGDTFTGDLRQYLHQESIVNPDTGSFGSVASLADPLSIDVNIVDGQTIESTADSDTAVALVAATGTGALTPATVASLAGDYIGEHTFCCDADDQNLVLTTRLTFDGTDVTGSTQVDDGDLIPIEGGITEFGDVSLIEFNWGDAVGFSGLVFFNPAGDGRVVFIGEVDGGDPGTISGILTPQ